MFEVNMKVAGVSFKQTAVEQCKVGDEIQLEYEPTNTFDKNAIKVMSDGRHLGYIPADSAIAVSEAINREDYKGCSIALMGRPPRTTTIGIRLVLRFEQSIDSLYPRSGMDEYLDPYDSEGEGLV